MTNPKIIYHFSCGCETETPNKRSRNLLLCDIHKLPLKYVIRWCEMCGKEMHLVPRAAKKRFCSDPIEITDRKGKKRMVNGCAGINQINKCYQRYLRLRKHGEKRLVKQGRQGRRPKYYEVRTLMRKYLIRYNWPVPQTPMIDRLTQTTGKSEEEMATALQG